MRFPEVIFKIIEEKKCPLYKKGDVFRLSGKTSLPEDNEDEKKFIATAVIGTSPEKPICRILYGDLIDLLVRYGSIDKIPKYDIHCSGCTGAIQLGYQKKKRIVKPVIDKHADDIGFATRLLNKFPIFQTLNESDIKKLIPMLKMKKFPKGANIIRKGESGSNLFIILSGKAEVLVDGNISISVLERGEVFGEISLLIGTPVGATIRVVDVVTVLLIYGRDFKKVLKMFPSLQMYFAQLLAERLAKTNVERLEEFTSGMIGKLADNPPSELFQTLNLNHKTGVLILNVSKGTAELVFREGRIIRAKYREKEAQEAFFELLKETRGRFSFTPGLPPGEGRMPEIGDFMWLLMEGTRRMDEEDNA